jgi:hypothetical protein
LISPFIGVDHYWMDAPTFAPHQHVGMSAFRRCPTCFPIPRQGWPTVTRSALRM